MTGVRSENPNADVALGDALDQLAEAAARPFETARPIPAVLNHSRAFHDHERKAVFSRQWVCIGRADELAGPGDFLAHDIAGVPVFAARQPDGGVRAFVNACAHRFACVVSEAKGTVKRFTCPYHAWTYGLDGKLLRAPKMDMKPGFDPAQHALRPLHAEVWEGFVYVTLAEKPEKTVGEALAPLKNNVVGRYDMSCYQTVLRQTMSWDANWKNLIENFIESYHVPYAHLKTFAKHGKPLEAYVCGEDNDHYCYHRAPQVAETGGGAAHPDNDRLAGEWRRMMVDFCVFPNHLVTLMPDYLWYISVQPEGAGRFRATWGVAIPPEVRADIADDAFDAWLSDLKAYMDIANGEDEVLVEALHRGTSSPLLPTGTYHPIEKNLWQFTRYLNRLCNSYG
jgi:phenylpropionate dioxygenase-like ring-hydroxylating dioxygenase large terminal subunit